MPRVNCKAAEYARSDFLRHVGKLQGYYGLTNAKALSASCGIPYSVLLRRLKDPETLTVEELRKLNNVLRFEPQELMDFIVGGKSWKK